MNNKFNLPWEKPAGPNSHYSDDGPCISVTFKISDVRMRVGPTNLLAPSTLRTRFKVECLTCDEVVHRGTTGATVRVESHLKHVHGIET